jgi:Mg2+ and Co2+ transporter CorA
MLQTFTKDAYKAPTLRLVKLRILHPTLDNLTGPHTINASQDEITRLWELFDLDPTTLHLLTKGVQGFNQHRPFLWDQSAKTFYFMASSFTYTIIWTYTVTSRSTSGIAVVRRMDTADRDFEHFCEALGTQSDIANHPLCLSVALTMQTMDAVYRGTLECQGQVASVEIITGFSPFNAPSSGSQPWGTYQPVGGVPEASHLPPRASSTNDASGQMEPLTTQSLNQVTNASRKIGAVLVHLEDDARQLRVLQRAVDSLCRAGFANMSIPGGCSDAGLGAEVLSAIQTLQQQMDSWEVRVDYLRERAKNQLTVLFNLIARYDAATGLAVSRAAKRDSSSMKAIAVMTMAFLPATFFAALFAVPSLPAVVQEEFWIYWVVAVPATVLVFVVVNFISGERGLPGIYRWNFSKRK